MQEGACRKIFEGGLHRNTFGGGGMKTTTGGGGQEGVMEKYSGGCHSSNIM